MELSTLYLGSVFIAGILSFFSPCVIPLLPVYISMFSASDTNGNESVLSRKKYVFLKSLLFVSGISVSFVILGFGAGVFGSIIQQDWFHLFLGAIVIVLGIHQMGIIHIPWLYYEKKVTLHKRVKNNNLSAFLLGFTFSFGWTPCIGPILGAILGISLNGDNAFYGALLMAIYALGFLIPFLTISLFVDTLMVKVKKVQKFLPQLKMISGLIIIFMGFLLMSDQLNIFITFMK